MSETAHPVSGETVTAVYDACVLYSAPLRHLLVSLAVAGLCRARWTEEIHDEWTRNLLAHRPDLDSAKIARTRQLMNSALNDCLVTGYESLIQGLVLPDANDRHVLAAAITAEASIIVTYNLSDFPSLALAPHGMEAQHPDHFLLELLRHQPQALVQVLEEIRLGLSNPPKSQAQYLDTLRNQRLPQLVADLEALGYGQAP